MTKNEGDDPLANLANVYFRLTHVAQKCLCLLETVPKYFEHRIILLPSYTNNQIIDWRKQLKREERAEINGWKLKKKILEHMFSFELLLLAAIFEHDQPSHESLAVNLLDLSVSLFFYFCSISEEIGTRIQWYNIVYSHKSKPVTSGFILGDGTNTFL